MTRQTYSERLRDPRWQRKRLEVMQRDEFSCQRCADTESTLNVHHMRYVKGRDPWEYDASELVTLCVPCHEEVHQETVALQGVIARSPMEYTRSFLHLRPLIAGFLNNQAEFNADPHTFLAGSVAGLLMEKAHVEQLMTMEWHLARVPRETRNQVLTAWVKALEQLLPPEDSQGPDA